MRKKVAVAMSGGVDSSVTAYLLKEAGYEVVGLTMDLLTLSCQIEHPATCCSLQAFQDAKHVADKLNIKHYIIDYKVEFEQYVINYFINEYISGRTPNPCIVCNKKIKFELLLNKARELGADYIATGHYANVIKQNDRYIIKKGIDITRDQSYFLYSLSQDQLRYIIMPLGKYKKEEDVRSIAYRLNLNVYNKPESQEICFIPDNNYRKFIQDKLSHILKPGAILDTSGKVLGKHQGIAFFTIGQRRGLNIAIGKPLYVIEIHADTNTIIVGNESELYNDKLIAGDVNWVAIPYLYDKMRVTAKIRYLHSPQNAVIIPMDNNKVKVEFDIPQRAITPGQSVVFYQDDVVVGGGVIERSFM
jgi:tRNA-specific 2-thiouridylase